MQIAKVDSIKNMMGEGLGRIFPQRVAAIQKGFTIPDYWGEQKISHIIDRLIRFSIGFSVKKQEAIEPGKLESLHKRYWEQADSYFEEARKRATENYIPAYQDIVEELGQNLIDRGINHVVEFGTGDGSWLDYLSNQLSGIEYFNGVDICEIQIHKNQLVYPHLQFAHADLCEWAELHAEPGSMFHTVGGVLEYLSEDSIKQLLRILKRRAKGSIVLFIEPLHGTYDIEKEMKSRVIGYEHSYTHNYVYLLRTAGYEVLNYEERTVWGHRMLVVLGALAD